MFEVSKQVFFAASHHVPGFIDWKTGQPGKCERDHGHTYTIGVSIQAPNIHPVSQMVIEFSFLTYLLEDLRTAWDHRNLNECFPFMNGGHVTNTLPTSEMVAYATFMHVSGIISKRTLMLDFPNLRIASGAFVSKAWCQEGHDQLPVYYYNPERFK